MSKPARPLPFPHRGAVVLACLVWALPAQAEIYKFVDDNGHVTYTNMPRPGAKKLDLGGPREKAPVPEIKPIRKYGTSRNTSPDDFPRVAPNTQRKRDDMRRQLLLEELSSEQRNLGAAQSAYTSGRRQPGAELNRLLDAVRLHEKNIEMLNKELGHLR